MNDKITVLSACANSEEAERIAQALVSERLAACVQILPQMRSIYRWQDRVEQSQEYLLLIKTSRARYSEVEARIIALHSYDTPEVVALPIVAGAEKYLGWMESELNG